MGEFMSRSVGVELEWADVDRHVAIPEYLGWWNDQDYSIVNSDGHANDPTGETWRWGGEVNTKPTETSAAQGEIVLALRKLLNPTVNFKCNLHVHVQPDVDLLEDLPLLKRVFARMRAAEDFVYTRVEPIVEPSRDDFASDEIYRGAKKRWRRNLQSHQHSLSTERFMEAMEAKTTDQFKDAHASPTVSGGRAWHIAKRPGMNFRSLWKHGTIEFRHFPGSDDPEEVVDSCEWCMRFVDIMITGDSSPRELFESRQWRFPRFQLYDHDLMLGFERTKWKQ
jgi:hypothetical protein